MSGRGSELASCDIDAREVERGLPYPLTSRYDRDTTTLSIQRAIISAHDGVVYVRVAVILKLLATYNVIPCTIANKLLGSGVPYTNQHSLLARVGQTRRGLRY